MSHSNNHEFCIADHASFREWLRVEVLWSNIEIAGVELFKGHSQIHKQVGPGETFQDFMEAAKLVHRQEAFLYEIGIMRSQGKTLLSTVPQGRGSRLGRCPAE